MCIRDSISGTFKVASLVSFRNGRPDRANYRRFKIKTVGGQNDFASVAEVVRRRYTRVLREATGADLAVESRNPKAENRGKSEARNPKAEVPEGVGEGESPVGGQGTALSEAAPASPAAESASRFTFHVSRPTPSQPALPDLLLIDGGKGQLSAAREELEKLGLGHIPTIGLAKEFEEIYRPGEKEPLRLSHESGALKLLQRVRDESHRFANTYNAQLRLRKISESILDEFPNIGQRRKAALLKKFGSVQRLRLASVEKIAEVSGFGGKAAAELKTFLEARQ